MCLDNMTDIGNFLQITNPDDTLEIDNIVLTNIRLDEDSIVLIYDVEDTGPVDMVVNLIMSFDGAQIASSTFGDGSKLVIIDMTSASKIMIRKDDTVIVWPYL